MKKIRLLGIAPWAIMLFACGLYMPTVSYEFAWDDAIVITENPRVQAGFEGLGWHWEKRSGVNLADKYGFRPLVMSFLGIEYGLWDANPMMYHVVNVVLFGLVCMLLYHVIHLFFPSESRLLPLITALIFSAHPVHVEVVANIKSIDEIMALGFGLGALLFYFKAFQQQQWLNLVWAVLLAIAAFLSKESALFLLPVMPLSVWLLQDQPLKMKLFALGPAIVVFVLGLWILVPGPQVAHDNPMGIYQESLALGNSLLAESSRERVVPTSGAILLGYLKNFLIPYPLVYYYGLGQYPVSTWSDPKVWGGFLFILVWAGLGIWQWRKSKLPAFALGFFLSTIFIYLHWMRPLADFMADRFLFTPSVALSLLLAWGICKAIQNEKAGQHWKQFASGNVLFLAISGVILTGFMALTLVRMPAWRNNLALFSTDIPHLPDCARCNTLYAGALIREDDQKGQLGRHVKDIEAHYLKAIELSDLTYNARVELAQYYYNLKQFDKGVALMRECVKTFPDAPRALYFLGYGLYFMQQYEEAILHFEASWKATPGRTDTPYMLSWAYFFGNRPSDAVALAQKCKVLFPLEWKFDDSLSDFYFGMNDAANGFAVLDAAIEKFGLVELLRKGMQRAEEGGDSERAGKYKSLARNKGLQL